jgi:glycosyltransferase involved in cell wall biosynthesis
MPTLNAAKYIKTSLDGLSAQSFKDFELLVVDSGSTDGTVDILRSYENLTARVIDAPVCSPALARNKGIENAIGDYIAFCDSDDRMKPDMLAAMVGLAVQAGADIAVCDFDMIYPERIIENFARLSTGEFRPLGDGVTDYYYRFGAAPKPNNYVWARLYRRGFLTRNAARFPDTRYSEDNLFNLSLLFKTPNIIHIGRSLYDYVQYDDSAMRKHIRRTNHGLLFLETFRNAADILSGHSENITEPILAIYAYTRVKSILFYAWQAGLPEAEIMVAISMFTVDGSVQKYLAICLDRDYIGRYCSLHGFSAEYENTVRGMLRACVDNTALPDMSEVFA